MQSASLRRTAAVAALFALPACGPVARAGANPSGSSSTPAAAPSEAGEPAADGPSATSSPHRTKHGAAHDGHRSSSAASPSGMCRSRDLKLSTEAGEGSGMGHAITRLVFQNASGHACWVRGYPGVSYVAGDNGDQIGGAARRDHSRPPSSARIWLIPNAHAYALLDQPNPHNYPPGRCDPTSVRGLRVYPPEQTASRYVADKGQACADTGTGRPRVSALSKSPDRPPG